MPDKNVVNGKLKNAEGRAQEAFGALTENPDDKAEGQAKQVVGKAQETVGHLKDAVKSASPTPAKRI